MRQKYCISQEGVANNLIIREYAIIDKELRNVKNSMLVGDDFALMYQENYEGMAIRTAIAKGLEALITTLRTANLFPIEPYASKIAESVVALYRSAEGSSMDLFFDDNEQPSAALA